MKTKKIKGLIIAIMAMAAVVVGMPMGAVGAGEMTGDYIIGPGDVLMVSVWNNEALTMPVTVLPDGKVHFPLIGEAVAGNKTVGDFKQELETRLKKFVDDPNLSVRVQQINSMMIYIVGKVNHPGRFAINTNVNVLQALAMAGGLNTFAKKNSISIFREVKGMTQIMPFEYETVTEGKKLSQNVLLQRGDVIVVP